MSVRKIEKKIILDKLYKKIDPGILEEDLIPEAFEIIIKKTTIWI